MPITPSQGIRLGGKIGGLVGPPRMTAQEAQYKYAVRKETVKNGIGFYYDPKQPAGTEWTVPEGLSPEETAIGKQAHITQQNKASKVAFDKTNKIAKTSQTIMDHAKKIWDDDDVNSEVKLGMITRYQNSMKAILGDEIWKAAGVDLVGTYSEVKDKATLQEKTDKQTMNLMQKAYSEYIKSPTLDNLNRYQTLFFKDPELSKDSGFTTPAVLENQYNSNARNKIMQDRKAAEDLQKKATQVGTATAKKQVTDTAYERVKDKVRRLGSGKLTPGEKEIWESINRQGDSGLGAILGAGEDTKSDPLGIR